MALPPNPPPPPPAPVPKPGPGPAPSPAGEQAPAAPELRPLSPYENLLGDTAAPEPAPTLTFKVAEAPPPPGPAPRAAEATPRPPLPGVIARDEPPVFVPALPPDEPPEPLLHAPVQPVPAPPPPPPVIPPPPTVRPPAAKSISELLESKRPRADESALVPPAAPEPVAWSASDVSAREAAARAASRPSRRPPGDDPVDDPSTLALSRFEEPSSLPHGARLHSAEPEADTVIAVAPPEPQAREGGPTPRTLVALLLGLLALWLLRLGAAPLFDVDEGAFAEATRELVTGHDWGSTTLNGVDRFDKPILVYWLQAIGVTLFGVDEFAVRLPSALCAFLWCVAIGHFAWRRFGPPAAVAAAAILATSLGPMLIGRAATADALLNLLLTLSTLDVWRHLENGRTAPRRRAFAWIGLGLLAKGPVAFLVPAAAAALWLAFGRDRSRLLRLVGDPKAWGLMVAIAAPWYAYALWRHGWAFVDGFLIHHNLQRFGGSLEGHAGSMGYYLELLPLLMLPWTALLVPLVARLRTRWREPLGRFLLLWFGFVLVFFSLSGTKLPHYVLYGFTPLVLLVGQELVNVRRGVRVALGVTMLAIVVVGAASPWIAHAAAQRTNDGLYRTLLGSVPGAPWAWFALPAGALVIGLTLWLPRVRSYLSDGECVVAAGALTALWLVLAVLPWWGQALQEPIRTLARTVPLAQLNLHDTQPLVQWRLHQPSIAFYVGHTVERRDPAGGDWALTRVDRLTGADLGRLEVVQQVRGYALVRPATAASEPLAQVGAARNAEEAASAAAAASAVAAQAAAVAAEAASRASALAEAANRVATPPATAPAASIASAPR